ncbi:MAG: NAD(P)-dependent alcohol dehydrogenase [Candidatus Eremiobacteraeota bacterium]|nr:NAD(P)-dependent alcohol dehydrogenase [Candidatus Eremiobacteraeota bacterium]
MRAVEYDAFGPAHVLEVRDVAEPPVCGADEIAVRVRAASVNPKDTFVRKGRFVAMTGTTFPRRAGYDWSGTVTDAGADVTGFAAGDLAYGMLNGWAGGACAEAIVVKASEAVRAPRSISLVSAAAIPLAALTALQALVDEAGLEAGRRVLVNGASGGVGAFGVQLAHHLGAHVTAVASGANEETCRDLGADAFVDYTQRPNVPEGPPFDVIFDVFGALRFEECAHALTASGLMVTTVPTASNLAAVSMTATAGSGERRMKLVVVTSRAADLTTMAELVDRGAVTAVIDRIYPLAEIRRAHEHVETKHTRGKVVVDVVLDHA